MTDDLDRGWDNLEGPWDRLRWARVRWQRKSGAINPKASDAAKMLGVPAGTYRSYEYAPGEPGHKKYDHQLAIRFGKRFGVSWPWLLSGEGTPFDLGEISRIQERVVRLMSGLDASDQETLAEFAQTFAQRRATAGR